MAAKQSTAVAPSEEAKLPAEFAPEFLSEIMEDAGTGVDNLGMDDVAVPYLYLLQTNSPQVNPDHDAYIQGAKSGMFLNNVTNEVFEGPLDIIPCAYERKYVEWVHRDDGGGYVRDYDIESNILEQCKPDEKGKPRLSNGHMIVETAYHYVYMKNPNTGRWEEIIVPMKSSALKKSRRWNKTLMSTFIPGTNKKAPRWLYPYQLTSVKEVKGTDTYRNYELARVETPVTVDQYRAAKAFAEQFSAGVVVRGKETLGEAEGGSENRASDGNSSPGMKEALDGEIPF